MYKKDISNFFFHLFVESSHISCYIFDKRIIKLKECINFYITSCRGKTQSVVIPHLEFLLLNIKKNHRSKIRLLLLLEWFYLCKKYKCSLQGCYSLRKRIHGYAECHTWPIIIIEFRTPVYHLVLKYGSPFKTNRPITHKDSPLALSVYRKSASQKNVSVKCI